MMSVLRALVLGFATGWELKGVRVGPRERRRAVYIVSTI